MPRKIRQLITDLESAGSRPWLAAKAPIENFVPTLCRFGNFQWQDQRPTAPSMGLEINPDHVKQTTVMAKINRATKSTACESR